jgi:mono/diheme cytochrome c family protein
VGDSAAGAIVYSANCSGCHGADPRTNNMSVLKGTTTTALTAAYQKVGSMNQFLTSMSATNNLNLAAYIQSRVP